MRINHLQRQLRKAGRSPLLLVCTLAYSASISACEIKMVVPETMFPPSFMRAESGEVYGLSIELAQALLAEAGCRASQHPMSFKRGLQQLKAGKVDMMMNLSMTDARKAFLNFVGPQSDETLIVVVPKGSDYKIESLDDFKNLPRKVGIGKGYFFGQAYHHKVETDSEFRNRFEEAGRQDLHVKKLNLGRISGFVGPSYNVYYRLKTDPDYRGFKAHPYVFYQNWVYFGFSKKSVNGDKLKKLEAAYARAVEKGALKSVLERYR